MGSRSSNSPGGGGLRRKVLAVIASVALAFSLVPATAVAALADVIQDSTGLQYTVDTNGNATITGFNGTVTTLIIPEKVGDGSDAHTVTAIAANAFNMRSDLARVEIPSTVEEIGAWTFSDCRNLLAVGFSAASQLQTIGLGAFYNCSSMASLAIPASVETVKADAFSGCSNIQAVTISVGSKLKNVESGAFSTWYETIFWVPSVQVMNLLTQSGVSKNKIRSSLKTEDGFSYLIDSVTDPAAPFATIMGYAGNGGALTIPSTIDSYPVKAIADSVFKGNKTITSVHIPASVTAIGAASFSGCTALAAVTFEEGSELESIGSSAFSSTGLTAIALPSSLRSIADNAFAYCGLVNIDLSGCTSLKNISANAFRECWSLKTVKLPVAMDSIDGSAFSYCIALTSVEGLDAQSIHQSAFAYCSNLTGITIGSNCKYVYSNAFAGCSKLRAVEFKGDVESIAPNAFRGCNYNLQVTVPTTAPAYPFELDRSQLDANTGGGSGSDSDEGTTFNFDYNSDGTAVLTSVVGSDPSITVPGKAPNGVDVVAIRYDAFSRVRSILKSVTIPSTVKTIGNDAFYGCSELETVTLSEGLETIGGRAFYRCASLESISIPASVVNLGTTSADYAEDCCDDSCMGSVFARCDALEAVTFMGASIEVIHAGTFSGCSALTSIEIPSSVQYIEPNAFNMCSSLVSVQLPSGLKTLGEQYCQSGYHYEGQAFYGCSSLRSISIPSGVTAIPSNTFEDCTSLQSVGFQAGCQLSRIGSMAFWYCESLEGFNVPASVKTLGPSCFYECSSLQNVTFEEGSLLESISNDAFGQCSALMALSIPMGVEEMGSCLFSGCTALETVNIPAGVATLESDTFYGCTSLTSVTFDAGSACKLIGSSCFSGCSSLAAIELPASMVDVEQDAFYRLAPNSVITVNTPELYALLYGDSRVMSTNRTTVVLKGADPVYGSGSMAATTVTLPAATYTYTGGNISPVPVVSFSSQVLTEGKDYTVFYSNNVGAGTARILLMGSGAYNGYTYRDFTIQPADISSMQVSVASSAALSNGVARAAVSISNSNTGLALAEGTDYSLSYANNTAAGSTATVTIAGLGNYKGTMSRTFAVTNGSGGGGAGGSGGGGAPAATELMPDQVGVDMSGGSSASGMGAAITATLKDGSVVTLIEGTDYTVAYFKDEACTQPVTQDEMAAAPGTYYASVAFQGAYAGTVVKPFTVQAAKPSEPGESGGEQPSGPEAPATAVIDRVTYTVDEESGTASVALSPEATSATVRSSVTIGGKTYKVTTLTTEATKGCSKLKSLTVAKGITKIEKGALANCPKLTELIIGRDVTSVPSQALAKCTKLKTVKIWSGKLSKKQLANLLKNSEVTAVKLYGKAAKAKKPSYSKWAKAVRSSIKVKNA